MSKHNSIMLGTLSISFPEMRVGAKSEAAKIEHDNGAKEGTITAAKHLLAGVKKHKAIKDLSARMRGDWIKTTIPMFDGRGAPRGFNALAAVDLRVKVGEWDAEYWRAVEDFLPEYPVIRAQRQFEMGSLFNERDFPPPDVLRRRFAFRCPPWSPLGDGNDLRFATGISPEDAQRFADEAVAAEKDRMAACVGEAAKKLFKVVQSLHATMKIPHGEAGGEFRNSKIENIIEIAELMPILNVTNDPGLAALAKQAKILATKSPDILREDAEVRKQTAAKAATLASKLASLFPSDAEDDDE